MDEAHHLPDVAVEAQAAGVVVGGHAKRLKATLEVIQRAGGVRAKVLGASALDRLTEAERDVASVLDALGRVVTPLLPASEASVAAGRRYGRVFGAATTARLHSHTLDGLRSELELGASRAKVLLDQVEREKEKLTKEPPAGTGSGMVSRIVRELGDASAWLQSCHDTLALLSSDDDEADAPRWLTRDPQGVMEVHASPVDASAWLANVVWRKAFGAAVVSATLRAMGDFRHFAERSGLRRIRETAYVALPSPFDLENSAVLRVPAMVSDPGSEDTYIAEVMLELPAGVDPAEATLILCASRALMDALVERAPASWKDRMKVQGRTAIAPLLDAHRADVAAGRGSILVGLATLTEGVDLGRQCSHVVIVKLPFASPM